MCVILKNIVGLFRSENEIFCKFNFLLMQTTESLKKPQVGFQKSSHSTSTAASSVSQKDCYYRLEDIGDDKFLGNLLSASVLICLSLNFTMETPPYRTTNISLGEK